MYQLQIIDRKGTIVRQKDLGAWRDHAAEIYGGAARKMDQKQPYKLALIEVIAHQHEEIYSTDYRWTELNRPW